MSGHVRSSSTVVTSLSGFQPRYQVVFPSKDEMDDQDEQYPEHDYTDGRTSRSPQQGRITSEHYTESATKYNASTGYYSSNSERISYEEQQQSYSQHYVIPPSPKEYNPPDSSSQHYVIPPEPREYVGPETVITDDWEPQVMAPAAQLNRQSGAIPPREIKGQAPEAPIQSTPDSNGSGQPTEDRTSSLSAKDNFTDVDLVDGATSGESSFGGSLKEKGIREIILGKDDKGKLGLKTKSIKKGIYVMEVVKGSPSARAGILPGDRILQINGIKVDSFDDEKMHEIFRKMPVKGIRMLVNKRPLEKTIKLQRDNNSRLGLTLRSTKIHTVVKGSPADIVGLSTDYYLIEVNGTNVRGKREDEIRKLMESCGKEMMITVMPYFLYEPLMKQIPIR